MFTPRKLIPILACISLAGCITYPNDGYYYSPNINTYDGDDYYGNDYGYDGNYGQYQYYGMQPSITFNFLFNFGYSGYSGYYPYYGYNSGYNNYHPCNSWSSYCYAYRPNYGWGYWPVYVYRPQHYHHHHNNDNEDGNGNDNGHGNGHANGNPPNRPQRVVRERPFNEQPRPYNRPNAPQQDRTPSLPVGSNPYVGVKPIPTRPASVDGQPRYQVPRNVQQPRPQPRERDESRPVSEDNEYVGVPTYTVQQPRPEPQQRAVRYPNGRKDLNQHNGESDAHVQQPNRDPQISQRQYHANRNNSVAAPQPTQAVRNNFPNTNAQIVQQPQPSPARQPRMEKVERKEPKKSNDDDEN